jgi:hypothetical protein
MEMMKNLKRCGRFRIERSCWPPADAKKLFVEIDPMTTTLVDGDVVDPVRVNNAECCICCQFGGARATISMPQLNSKAEIAQRHLLEKQTVPHLECVITN